MSEKEQPPMMEQKLCVAGCGFFGSSQTSQMCSKCWKDAMSKSMLEKEGKKDGVVASPLTAATVTAMDEEDTTPCPAEAVDAAGGAGSGATSADANNASIPAPAAGAPLTPPAPAAAAAPLTPPPAPAAAVTPTASVALTTTTSTAAAAAEMASLLPPQPPAQSSISVSSWSPSSSAAAPSSSPFLFGTGASPAIGGGAVAEGAGSAAGAAMEARPVQKNRKRCFTCSRKVGYTGIACRCDYVFCSLHRYPEQHDCTFDFKTSDRNDLKRTVVGGGQFSKIDRL